MDTGSYNSLNLGNPLSYLFNSALCYVVSGVAVLVVGVIITSVSFQNLDPYHEGNKARFAGPVMMGAGLLIMGRGAFYRLRNHDCRGLINFYNRHRTLLRRLLNLRDEEDSEEQAIYLEPTDPEDLCLGPRTRPLQSTRSLCYPDDPPPYHEALTAPAPATPAPASAVIESDNYGAITNPALQTDDEEPLPPPYESVMHIR